MSVVLVSCHVKKNEQEVSKENRIVASVKNNHLYESDLSSLFLNKMPPDDSQQVRRNFINNWVKQQLIFNKALENLDDSSKDKSNELSNYYQSLIKYEYEKKLVEQRLNNKVSSEEALAYYKEHSQNFLLSECIARLIFIDLPANAPDKAEIKKWYKSDEIDDRDMLYQYCLSNAKYYILDDKQWNKLEDVLVRTPWQDKSCNSFYLGQYLESEDSTGTYFLRFKEIKRQNEISPFEFVKEKIKNIILYQRSQDLIKKAEEKIFEEGFKQNYVTIYDEEN